MSVHLLPLLLLLTLLHTTASTSSPHSSSHTAVRGYFHHHKTKPAQSPLLGGAAAGSGTKSKGVNDEICCGAGQACTDFPGTKCGVPPQYAFCEDPSCMECCIPSSSPDSRRRVRPPDPVDPDAGDDYMWNNDYLIPGGGIICLLCA